MYSKQKGDIEMMRDTVGVIMLVILGIVLTGAFARAEDSGSLSTEDEHAYQEAYASWKHNADINKEVGLPPQGEEPERVDFIGSVAKRKENIELEALAQADAGVRWEKRLEEVRPYLCTLVPPGVARRNDYRSQTARQEKEQPTHACG